MWPKSRGRRIDAVGSGSTYEVENHQYHSSGDAAGELSSRHSVHRNTLVKQRFVFLRDKSHLPPKGCSGQSRVRPILLTCMDVSVDLSIRLKKCMAGIAVSTAANLCSSDQNNRHPNIQRKFCQGEYFSTEISAAASAWELLTALENMPNVGTVSVEDTSSGLNAVWVVTFTSAVSDTSDFPGLQVRTTAPLNPVRRHCIPLCSH